MYEKKKKIIITYCGISNWYVFFGNNCNLIIERRKNAKNNNVQLQLYAIKYHMNKKSKKKKKPCGWYFIFDNIYKIFFYCDPSRAKDVDKEKFFEITGNP